MRWRRKDKNGRDIRFGYKLSTASGIVKYFIYPEAWQSSWYSIFESYRVVDKIAMIIPTRNKTHPKVLHQSNILVHQSWILGPTVTVVKRGILDKNGAVNLEFK